MIKNWVDIIITLDLYEYLLNIVNVYSDITKKTASPPGILLQLVESRININKYLVIFM